MDYYQILGISKDSSQDDIKVAYKKLAMKYHPDKGGNTKHLSQINQAYETLKDPEKRKLYDQNFKQKNKFDSFVTLNLCEVFRDFEKKVTLFDKTGVEKQISLTFPKGVKHGDKIEFKNIENKFHDNLVFDEITLRVILDIPKEWEVKGKDIYTTIKVSTLDLLSGSKKDIFYPTGDIFELDIPQGTQPNSILRMKDCGLPENEKSTAGDMIVHLSTYTPKINNPKMLKKLHKISKKAK